MAASERIVVNGNDIPTDLAAAIEAGWIEHVDRDAAAARLGVSCRHLSFYRMSYITGLLAGDWLRLPDAYRGSPGGDVLPGNIDPATSLCFGEVESDSPLAIDFRTNPPSVVAFPWPRWVRVSNDVSEFLEKLDPGGVLRDDADKPSGQDC